MTTEALRGAALVPAASGAGTSLTTLPTFPEWDDPVARWARLAPRRAALVDDAADAVVTYAALDALTARWASALAARGAGPGDRVALLAGTRPECVALFYACARIGAALVPLNWRLAPPELARVLDDARPGLCVVEDRYRALADAARALVRVPCGDLLPLAAPEVDPAATPRPHAGGSEDATMILYTSGSTGAPKGVVLPRRQLLFNAVATTVAWELGAADVAPVSTPLFHTGGWHVFLTPLLHVGGTVVLCDGFDAERFAAMLRERACTIAFGVPTQLAMLAQTGAWGEPLPRLRRLISGGAPCPPSVRRAVREAGYGFRQGFGLTECGPNCFATNDETADERPDSVGWPIPFLGVRVAREDGSEPAPDEPGELLLRGPQMFAGYFGAPGRTAEALTADGWLRTGDLARRDASGVHTICGRRKEMFISGGENVFPGEVEAALSDCPGVAEVAVVGMPDAKWGEVGCAFVVRRGEGREAGAGVDGASLVAFARGRLAGYQVPKRVVLVDALPRLGSGKVDRSALGRLAAGSSAETPA